MQEVSTKGENIQKKITTIFVLFLDEVFFHGVSTCLRKFPTNTAGYWRRRDVDFSGYRTYHGPQTVTPHAERFASQIQLYPNYRNPINPATTIAFDMPKILETE